jgi:hypothetical protein
MILSLTILRSNLRDFAFGSLLVFLALILIASLHNRDFAKAIDVVDVGEVVM